MKHIDTSMAFAGVAGTVAVSIEDEVMTLAIKVLLGVVTGVLSGLGMKLAQYVWQRLGKKAELKP